MSVVYCMYILISYMYDMSMMNYTTVKYIMLTRHISFYFSMAKWEWKFRTDYDVEKWKTSLLFENISETVDNGDVDDEAIKRNTFWITHSFRVRMSFLYSSLLPCIFISFFHSFDRQYAFKISLEGKRGKRSESIVELKIAFNELSSSQLQQTLLVPHRLIEYVVCILYDVRIRQSHNHTYSTNAL